MLLRFRIDSLDELILRPEGGVHRRRYVWRKERSPLPWTGAPCSPQRTWAEKDGAQPLPTLLLRVQKDCGQEQESLCNEVKAFEEPIFGPCTLWRTWGTRPEPKDRGGEIVRRDSGLLVQYLARDNQALDLAGTFADGAEFNVAVELLDRVVFDETVTTVKLHCLIADPDRHLTGH